MTKLTIREIMEYDEGYIYSILRENLIPFKKEEINISDNDYSADAKFIVNTIEDVHPYFLTEYYNFKEYKKTRDYFLKKCKNTSLFNFKLQILKYFKVLSDGHMSIMQPDNYELNNDFEYVNNTLYFKSTKIKILKIGEIGIRKILKKIDEYFYFENFSNKELYIPEYLKGKLFLEYIGCKVIDNKIEILTDIKLEYCEFINKESKNSINNYTRNISNYTIKSDMIDDIFYIDFQECKINNQLNIVIENIKNAISNGINKFIIDIRNNLGGTADANERILDALNIESATNGAIIRLSNNIKRQFKSSYNFDDISEDKINYVFYKPKLKSAKKNDNIKLVLLTSKYTYSSAMQLALEISDGNLGLVIGEIPSNAPCCFGDMYYSETPRLKLPFKVSHKYFLRPNLKKGFNNFIPNIEIDGKRALNKAVFYLKNIDKKENFIL